jgi:hypothetical protein
MNKANYCNQGFGLCLAFCCCLSTVKFLKLFRFNMKLSALSRTLKYSMKELIGFTTIFFLIWISFVQVMYLIFHEKASGYSTIIKSMETSFEIMLGKFDVRSLVQANLYFGSLIFFFYNIMIVFIMLNIFISIVSSAFQQVRKDNYLKENDFEMLDYLLKKIKLFFNVSIMNEDAEIRSKEKLTSSYLTNVDLFPDKVNLILLTLGQVRFEKNSLLRFY